MPQQPQPQSNSGKSSTYVQLPDNSYLEVPAGVSDQEVHSRISGMFPDAFKSDPSAASPIAPPTIGKPQAPDMRKVYLNTGNPVPDRPGIDLLTKNGAGVARAIYSQTTPGVIHGLLKRFGVIQSGPDLIKETIPNAVATFAGGLEGAPEGAGGEGGARPVERSGSNRPATRGPVPGRATPSKSTFGPMDAATLLPGMAGRAARLLQKFGVGQAETAAPQMAEPAADFGTPSHLRGQRVKAGTLEIDRGIPKSVRPEPAWKSQPSGGTTVESILHRNPEAGLAKPREGNPSNPGGPFPRKPTWQNQPTPESRAASDAAFNKLHPVSEFKSGMDPVAEAQWQESAFGQKPVEDIGAKVRASQPPVPRTTTATAKGRAIDNQALGNVMKGEDARNLSTSDLSSRLQEAAKSANRVKSGPDLLVKKMKASDVGEINPHPRRYYPEQDISDEELGNTLGLRKKIPPTQ
jgi:hypothetical protein